jgi:hypothetical protein
MCKKKGIPDCNLFVAQRNNQLLNPITNYSTQSPIIGYSSIRSSRRPGSRRRNLLHSSKSLASSRFHFHSTLLKKEMDNELTIVFFIRSRRTFSSQEIKKEIGSFIQQRLGSEIFGSYSSKVWRPTFFASTG